MMTAQPLAETLFGQLPVNPADPTNPVNPFGDPRFKHPSMNLRMESEKTVAAAATPEVTNQVSSNPDRFSMELHIL